MDPQVRTADGKTYDILIIGTDKGKVIRAINTESYDSVSKVRPVVIEEIKVFETEAAITNLRFVPQTDKVGPRLIVVSNDEIQTIPLHRCYTDSVITCRWVFILSDDGISFFPALLFYRSVILPFETFVLMDCVFLFGCSECVALQDPYCAWNAATSRCVTVASVAPTAQSALIQSIFTGYSDQCPDNGKNKQVPLNFIFYHTTNVPLFFFVFFYVPKKQLSLKRKTGLRHHHRPKQLVSIFDYLSCFWIFCTFLVSVAS